MSTLAVEPPQHMRALSRANEVRLARSALKRSVAAGNITAGTVISTCPWEAETMAVAELLQCQRRWGATRSSAFLAEVGIPETKTIGSFTDRQRRLMATLV